MRYALVGLATAAVFALGSGAQAAPLGAAGGLGGAAEALSLSENAQFFYGGASYCWYDGWRGPGSSAASAGGAADGRPGRGWQGWSRGPYGGGRYGGGGRYYGEGRSGGGPGPGRGPGGGGMGAGGPGGGARAFFFFFFCRAA